LEEKKMEKTTMQYRTADGHTVYLEVSEDFKRGYEEMESKEQRVERRETRRHLSLEMLMELEEEQNNWGGLESISLGRSRDERYSLVSSEPDPLEALLQKEQESNLPIVKALSSGLELTDYQKRIAVGYYIDNKTQTRIAEELGVSRMAVCHILKKVQKKVITALL
jgi:DNA-directed RNA polymerase specialized sigma subunit